MTKPAPAAHPILDVVRERWSPRAFAPRPVPARDLLSLLEAARWAPSSVNEQPWRFVVARREDATAFAALLACLSASNQRWAKDAGALLVVATRTHFSRNEKPNAYAFHDAGLALGHLLLEATARGLATHPMAGFDAVALRAALDIPAGYEPVTAVAVGFPGDVTVLPEDLQAREAAPRSRQALSEFVYEGTWNQTPAWVEKESR